MSQTYKNLQMMSKTELIAIIKDCDYTINCLSRQIEKMER